MLPVNYVRIRILSKKRSPQILIPIEMNQTVELLKEKIYEKTNIKESSQILKFKKEKEISLLKDRDTLASYGIGPNSIITLKKYFIDDSDDEEPPESELESEDSAQKMDINKRIDFYKNLTWKRHDYEMQTIQEEKNDDSLGEDEESKLVQMQKNFLLFCKKNIKSQTNDIIEQLSKLSAQILREVVEFQAETGYTCLHYLIENKMDYIITFLIKQLDRDILEIQGENCATPLVFAVIKVASNVRATTGWSISCSKWPPTRTSTAKPPAPPSSTSCSSPARSR